MNDFIDDFVKQIIGSGLASWWTMRGCRDFEIRDLENHFDIKLPAIYKDFLKKMGKSAGEFMQGTDIFFDYLFDNREAMEEVLELDDNPFFLEKEFFIFSSHQGYIFHFFNTAEDVFDPPVYGYKEGELKVKRIDTSFSTFLLNHLEGQKKIRNLY